MKNLKTGIELWDSVASVDPKYTKKANNGNYSFTNIDAYYIFEKATKQVGSMGKGFGLKDVKIDEVVVGDTILLKLIGIFYHGDIEMPCFNAIKLAYKTSKGYQKVDDEAYKKIYTNTISKYLSYIGYGASIFQGKFEDDRYFQNAFVEAQVQKEMEAATETQREEIVFLMNETESDEAKMLSFVKIDSLDDLTVAKYEVLKQALFAKKQKGNKK